MIDIEERLRREASAEIKRLRTRLANEVRNKKKLREEVEKLRGLLQQVRDDVAQDIREGYTAWKFTGVTSRSIADDAYLEGKQFVLDMITAAIEKRPEEK